MSELRTTPPDTVEGHTCAIPSDSPGRCWCGAEAAVALKPKPAVALVPDDDRRQEMLQVLDTVRAEIEAGDVGSLHVLTRGKDPGAPVLAYNSGEYHVLEELGALDVLRVSLHARAVRDAE